MQTNTLTERAVLMRLSIGLPGENRGDASMTTKVVRDHNLGSEAGKWMKRLYPPKALAKIKSVDNEARQYHASVTLPWDTGIGILPAALLFEHGNKMREFQDRRNVLIDEFLSDPQKWIDWAVVQHNGGFDPALYPGCEEAEPLTVPITGRKYRLDVDVFKREVRKQFYFKSTPLPVPRSEHFSETVSALLGTDTQSVDSRVSEAQKEAQGELMKRLMDPVTHMAAKLANKPCSCRACKGKVGKTANFKDSLIEKLAEIARIAPSLNLTEDPQVDKFVAEIEVLAAIDPEKLRKDDAAKTIAQQSAEALAKKMAAYNF